MITPEERLETIYCLADGLIKHYPPFGRDVRAIMETIRSYADREAYTGDAVPLQNRNPG